MHYLGPSRYPRHSMEWARGKQLGMIAGSQQDVANTSLAGETDHQQIASHGHGKLCLDDAYVTTYQRDIGTAQTVFHGERADNVGQKKKQRGKRMFHSTNNGSFGSHSTWGGSVPSAHVPIMDRSTTAASGHVPGYTGHIPQARQYHFKPEEIRDKNHQKDFFLLPSNYRQHKTGYTGKAPSTIEASKDSKHML
eukprot:jgi/Ulvmu1/8307/UM042_0012.1